jgi:IS5 family transposase
MFKVILLKKYYNLNPQSEYQIIDRQSFRDFVGLASGDDVPDSRTIWLFQDIFIKQGLEKELFAMFSNKLYELGLFVNEGKIVDASFVKVSIQCNTKEENEDMKNAKGGDLWQDKPHKKRQKVRNYLEIKKIKCNFAPEILKS